jgi:hypothetical protein
MITSTECETGQACPNPTPFLQPVLGTDKRNPIFSVCRQGGATPSLHVYYGAELLEVVPENRQHPAYQLLVARLYNAGVKGLAPQRHFQVDRKTMQRWGRALQSGDAEKLVQALAGRGGRRKLTPEIRAFVRVRFPEIYGQSRVGYSQRLRAEVERVADQTMAGHAAAGGGQYRTNQAAGFCRSGMASGPDAAQSFSPAPTFEPTGLGLGRAATVEL